MKYDPQSFELKASLDEKDQVYVQIWSEAGVALGPPVQCPSQGIRLDQLPGWDQIPDSPSPLALSFWSRYVRGYRQPESES